MATPADQLALYGQWHKFADADGDGIVSGGEAVSFFQRSGLDQITLGQVCAILDLTRAQHKP
jgi:hypothetical protein